MHRDIIGTTRTVLNDVKRRRKHDIAEKISKLNDENTSNKTIYYSIEKKKREMPNYRIKKTHFLFFFS